MYLISNNKEECTGCTACKNICPQNAIKMDFDEEGFLYPMIDKSKCINCKKCEKVCPQSNILRNKLMEAYGLKNKNIEERKQSSSGGAFSVISDYILSCDGIIYGAALNDDLKVVHTRAVNKNERDKMRKTKYVQSDLKDIFKQVELDLKRGKIVLFSGTPCQVNGLNNYLKGRDVSNLYTCDLICHGVPSPRLYEDYLKYIGKKGKIENFNFRNKKYGWESVYETYTIHNKEHCDIKFRELFYTNIVLRPSCYCCEYSNLDRVSDITIGDFWGIEKVNCEFKDNIGVSLVIINTQKGKEILDNIKDDVDIISVNIQDALQHNLVAPTICPQNRDIFWQEYQARGFRYILKKYVPKMYDKNVNPFLWTIHKGYYKIKNKFNWKEKSKS